METNVAKESTARKEANLQIQLNAFDYVISAIFPAAPENYHAVYDSIMSEAEKMLNETLRIQVPGATPGSHATIPIRFLILPVDKVELDKLVPVGVKVETKLEMEKVTSGYLHVEEEKKGEEKTDGQTSNEKQNEPSVEPKSETAVSHTEGN